MIGLVAVPLRLIWRLVVSAYVPPRIAIVPPSGTTFTAFWIVASGWVRVPGLASLPLSATISAPDGNAAALGAMPAGVSRTARITTAAMTGPRTARVGGRSIAKTYPMATTWSMSVETRHHPDEQSGFEFTDIDLRMGERRRTVPMNGS